MHDVSRLPLLSELKRGDHLLRPDFDNFAVPEEFAPARYLADDAAIKSYCYAVDCYDPWYFEAVAPFGYRLAPSAMVLKELMWFYMTRYDRTLIRGFHQREAVRFHRPVPAGTELVFTGRNPRKYVRRGRGYLIHESEARDASGNLYVSQSNTELISMSVQREDDAPADVGSSHRIEPRWSPEARVVARASENPCIDDRLPEAVKRPDRAQVAVFSGIGDDFLNIHTDRRVAGEMEFAEVVVQGLMNVCWLSEELTRWSGGEWLSTGSMNATFLKPMLAGETTRLGSRVSEVDGGKIGLETCFTGTEGEVRAVASAVLGG